MNVRIGAFPETRHLHPRKAVGEQRLKHQRREDTHIERRADLEPVQCAQRGHVARPVRAEIAGKPCVDGRGIIAQKARQFVEGIGGEHLFDAGKGQALWRLRGRDGGLEGLDRKVLRRQLWCGLCGALRGHRGLLPRATRHRGRVDGLIRAPGQCLDHVFPGDLHVGEAREPRLPHAFGEGRIGHQLLEGLTQLGRLWRGDAALFPVGDEFERTACVGDCDHRTGGQHRLEGDVAVILVLRDEDDRARLGIMAQERGVIDAAQPCHPVGHPQFEGQRVQILLVAGVFGHARDHEADFRSGGGQPAQDQLQPFRRVDAARCKEVVAILALPEPLGIGGRMVERCGFQIEILVQAFRHIAGIGIERMWAGGEGGAVLGMDELAQRITIRVVHQIGIPRRPEVIGGAVLVDDPEELVGVVGQPGRELEPDRQINRHTFEFRDVMHPRGEDVIGQHFAGIPFEGQRDLGRLVAIGVEGADQIGGVAFGPALHEGDLGAKDTDAHGLTPRPWGQAWCPARQGPADQRAGRPVRR